MKLGYEKQMGREKNIPPRNFIAIIIPIRHGTPQVDVRIDLRYMGHFHKCLDDEISFCINVVDKNVN